MLTGHVFFDPRGRTSMVVEFPVTPLAQQLLSLHLAFVPIVRELNDRVDLDIERPMEHDQDDGSQVSEMVDRRWSMGSTIGRRPDHDDVVVCRSLYFDACPAVPSAGARS
jgi:hypothetical protein